MLMSWTMMLRFGKRWSVRNFFVSWVPGGKKGDEKEVIRHGGSGSFSFCPFAFPLVEEDVMVEIKGNEWMDVLVPGQWKRGRFLRLCRLLYRLFRWMPSRTVRRARWLGDPL